MSDSHFQTARIISTPEDVAEICDRHTRVFVTLLRGIVLPAFEAEARMENVELQARATVLETELRQLREVAFLRDAGSEVEDEDETCERGGSDHPSEHE